MMNEPKNPPTVQNQVILKEAIRQYLEDALFALRKMDDCSWKTKMREKIYDCLLLFLYD